MLTFMHRVHSWPMMHAIRETARGRQRKQFRNNTSTFSYVLLVKHIRKSDLATQELIDKGRLSRETHPPHTLLSNPKKSTTSPRTQTHTTTTTLLPPCEISQIQPLCLTEHALRHCNVEKRRLVCICMVWLRSCTNITECRLSIPVA